MFDFLKDAKPLDDEGDYEMPEYAAPETDELFELPEGWVYLGERNGKPHYRTAPGIAVKKPSAVVKALMTLPVESSRHEVGDTCPHCKGVGRYSAHLGHFRNEKCFRCDGKGELNEKDIALLDRRMQGAGPVCHVVTA